MNDSCLYGDLTSGIFSALKRNPVLYFDLKTRDAVVLQQEIIAVLRSKKQSRHFLKSKEERYKIEEARQVLEKEDERYLRMPGVRMPKTREWMLEFKRGCRGRKTRRFLQNAIRQSRTLSSFSRHLHECPTLLEDWLNFKAEKLMQEFVLWTNSLPSARISRKISS
jgi:hypothetical protein